jgi:Pentapeptide repeats (9 copies)
MASFNTMKVGHYASFNKAAFAGPVDFGYADVKGTASFEEAVFAGPVDFGNAVIGVTLDATKAKFNDSKNTANFNTIRVEGAAFFEEAVFAGPVRQPRRSRYLDGEARQPFSAALCKGPRAAGLDAYPHRTRSHYRNN